MLLDKRSFDTRVSSPERRLTRAESTAARVSAASELDRPRTERDRDDGDDDNDVSRALSARKADDFLCRDVDDERAEAFLLPRLLSALALLLVDGEASEAVSCKCNKGSLLFLLRVVAGVLVLVLVLLLLLLLPLVATRLMAVLMLLGDAAPTAAFVDDVDRCNLSAGWREDERDLLPERLWDDDLRSRVRLSPDVEHSASDI